MEVTQTEFAKLAGVSKAAISKAIKTGLLVKTAAKKIDTDDGLSKTYLLRKSMKPPESPLPKAPKRPGRKKAAPDASTIPPDNSGKFDLALQKIKEEIGDIRAKRQLKEIKVQEAKDALVQRDRLARVVFGYLDTLNACILDAPETMIDYIIDKVKAGAKKGELVKYMRDSLGVEIKSTKKQVAARLK